MRNAIIGMGTAAASAITFCAAGAGLGYAVAGCYAAATSVCFPSREEVFTNNQKGFNHLPALLGASGAIGGCIFGFCFGASRRFRDVEDNEAVLVIPAIVAAVLLHKPIAEHTDFSFFVPKNSDSAAHSNCPPNTALQAAQRQR